MDKRLLGGAHLLISAFDDDTSTGGLFIFDGDRMDQIDSLPTTGVAVDGGNRLVRTLRSKSEPGSLGEALVYDENGVRLYLRIDELCDPHDIAWVGNGFVAISATAAPKEKAVRIIGTQGVSETGHRAARERGSPSLEISRIPA